MEKTKGVYRLTQVSAIYDFYQKALGSDRARKTIVANHICPKDGDLVLDLGCGSGDIFPYLGDINYVGIDRNQNHIENATSQFRSQAGTKAVFHCGDFSEAKNFTHNGYDFVLCLGLFHHLSDQQVKELSKLVDGLLKPSGRLIGVDPAFIENQKLIAKKFAEWDSGQNVRAPQAYCNLLSDTFSDVRFKIYNNLLRVPYTHCITTAQKGNI